MKKSYPERISEEDVLFFLHIPKTGGTSLTTALTEHWGDDLTLTPGQLNTAKAQPKETLANAKFVYGHFSRAVCRRRLPSPPNFTITFLRDPVAHFVSIFYHLRRDTNFAYSTRITLGDKERSRQVSELARDLSLKDFLQQPEADLFDNFQIKYLVRGMRFDPDVQDSERLRVLSKKCLKELGAFGITERYTESLQLIGNALDLGTTLKHLTSNAAPNKPKDPELVGDTIREIEARTQLDRELYRYANSIFDQRLNAITA
jgi:hypothetical protein